jgi:integrase
MWNRMKSNPCEKVEPPRKGRSQISPMAVDEFAQLLVHLQRKLFVPMLFLSLTGVRRNEMLGCYQASVDLQAGTAFIERQQVKLLDGTIGTKDTKTSRRRMVDLVPQLVYAIELHLKDTPGEYLFPRPGTYEAWPATSFSSSLRKAGRQIEVAATAQRIRRVFSSLALSEGGKRAVIAEIMGHSVKINAEHYETIDRSAKRAATESVAETVGRLVGKLGLSLDKP